MPLGSTSPRMAFLIPLAGGSFGSRYFHLFLVGLGWVHKPPAARVVLKSVVPLTVRLSRRRTSCVVAGLKLAPVVNSAFTRSRASSPPPGPVLPYLSVALLAVIGSAVPVTCGHSSHASPTPSKSASSWRGLAIAGQLSQASPLPSPSVSVWSGLLARGQLSGGQVCAG